MISQPTPVSRASDLSPSPAGSPSSSQLAEADSKRSPFFGFGFRKSLSSLCRGPSQGSMSPTASPSPVERRRTRRGTFRAEEPSFDAIPLDSESPVVFLDIDGVVFAPAKSNNMNEGGQYLAQILRAAQAEVVLSSTWRTHWLSSVSTNTAGVADMLQLLPDPFIRMGTREMGGSSEEGRAAEILDWFNGPGRNSRTRWVALDDLNLHATSKGAAMNGHFVHVDSVRGMSARDAAVAVKLFKSQGVRINESELSPEVRSHLA